MNNPIRKLAESVQSEVVEDRRWLHRHPELSFKEIETAGYVARRLREIGLEPETGIGGNGMRVVIQGERPGPTVALRADMDALPIEEETGLPFTSAHLGVMHACGHDAHTAMLLGAARAFTRMDRDWAGTVVLIFQPAEEVPPGGASSMIRDGVLKNPDVDAVFGMHINPFSRCGCLEFGAGTVMASMDNLEIVVRGKGGHAAAPHEATDPVPVAAQVVSALQHIISRNVSPTQPAVLTIGSIHGGSAYNVIASEVALKGTIRAMDATVRDQIPKLMERVAQGVASAHGCEVEVNILPGYSPVVNDAEKTALAARAAARVVSAEQIGEIEPRMGGEDFAFYLEEVPGSFARIGVAPEGDSKLYPLHNSRLKVDERAFATGVAYWLAVAQEFLR